MRKEEWEQTNKALLDSTREVFSHCGATLTYVSRDELPSGWTKLAVIGFAGESMRGMLAILLDPKLVERTCPVETRGKKNALDDWLCELANLLLGRFKSELLRLGVTVHLSTPMLVEGINVALDTDAIAAVVHRFTSEHSEAVFVVLDAAAGATTHLHESLVPIAASGTVVLFDGGDHA